MNSFCVLDADCAVYDRRTGTPGLSVGRIMCFGCESHYRNVLAMLRLDFVDLSQFIARPQVFSDTKISRPKPASTPPIDLHVFTLRDDILMAVGIWDAEVRRRCHTPRLPGELRDGFRLDAMIRFLDERLDVLAGIGAVYALHDGGDHEARWATGVEGLLRLAEVHRAARIAVGLAERVVKLPGFCPSCAVAAMRREEAGDKVWCAACHQALSYDTYVDHMKFVRVRLDQPVVTDGPAER